MRAKELVQSIIGSKGFIQEDITIDAKMKEIKLSVRPTKREKGRCGICHRRAPSYDKGRGKRLFDKVIVWKLNRFARNRYDSARYKAGLKKNGIKVVSATEIISEGGRRRSFWNPSLRVTPNTIPPICPRRLSGR